MHDGGTFAYVGTQTYSGGVGNTYTLGHHVIGHLREFVDRLHFQNAAFQACLQLPLRQLIQVNGAFVSPGQVGQQTKNAVQLQAVGLGQAV